MSNKNKTSIRANSEFTTLRIEVMIVTAKHTSVERQIKTSNFFQILIAREKSCYQDL